MVAGDHQRDLKHKISHFLAEISHSVYAILCRIYAELYDKTYAFLELLHVARVVPVHALDALVQLPLQLLEVAHYGSMGAPRMFPK